MSDFHIHPRDTLMPFSMATGEHHRVVIHHFKVAMVELEDLHFHNDSAVLMPDHDPADASDAKSGADLTAFSVLRACYLYAKDNPKKKVVCLGHTDRSGDDAYNIELSALRAKNVWAVIKGKQDDWTAVCKKKHVVSDYQLILKWLANVRYWLDCDPGKIDGIHGNQTSNALRAFKKHYNKDYGGSLADSGAVDKATWDAFFKMYMVGLAGVMQVDEAGLDPYRQSLDWMSPAWDGCGEAHPKTSSTLANYPSGSRSKSMPCLPNGRSACVSMKQARPSLSRRRTSSRTFRPGNPPSGCAASIFNRTSSTETAPRRKPTRSERSISRAIATAGRSRCGRRKATVSAMTST
jgi:hypothetical protein